MYGGKSQSNSDPGQFYRGPSLSNPEDANKKEESADQLEIKAERALYSLHVV
jgi:hypothetical protein